LPLNQRSIKSIACDEKRRGEAKRDLVAALQSYIDGLSAAKERDALRETDLFCAYAREDYDSRAEARLKGMPPPIVAFEVGNLNEPQDLIGSTTIGEVLRLVKIITVPRPASWPFFFQPGESPEMRSHLLSIVQGCPERFEWLLEDPWGEWFRGQLRDCIHNCVRFKRQDYERRLSAVSEPNSFSGRRPKSGEPERLQREEFMRPILTKRTLSAIATRSGVEYSSLHRWHAGKTRLSPENRTKLARDLDVELALIPD